MPKLPKVSAT